MVFRTEVKIVNALPWNNSDEVICFNVSTQVGFTSLTFLTSVKYSIG